MKKIISMALICAILFSAGLTSNINAAESTKSTESKLKANQSEQKELDEKINDLNEKIKKVEGNIDSANEKMEKLNEESESLQKDIKKLKEDGHTIFIITARKFATPDDNCEEEIREKNYKI